MALSLEGMDDQAFVRINRTALEAFTNINLKIILTDERLDQLFLLVLRSPASPSSC